MPQAKPPIAPVPPAPVTAAEKRFIKATIKRFYGADAIVRNFGPDPKRLCLHVEAGKPNGLERYDCLGVLMTRIKRDQISLDITKRGARIFGTAKIAYRQGIVL